MKVILLKDVPKLGRKDELKDVPQGHAINFLIPRKLVVVATPQLIQALHKRKSEEQAHKQIADELIRESLQQIAGKVVVVKEKANAQGHLFSKVVAQHIVDAVKRDSGVVIDESWITLVQPIKTVGTHEVCVQHGVHKVACTIDVQPA